MSDAATDLAHKTAMDAIGMSAQLLTNNTDALMALVKAEKEMHSYLHITNPTLYLDAIHSKGLAQQVRLAKAALAFVAEVQAVKDELA